MKLSYTKTSEHNWQVDLTTARTEWTVHVAKIERFVIQPGFGHTFYEVTVRGIGTWKRANLEACKEEIETRIVEMLSTQMQIPAGC